MDEISLLSCRNFSLHMSVEKTKCMKLSPYPLQYKLIVNNSIIEQTIEVKYPGVILASDGPTQIEIDKQIAKADRIFFCLTGSI